MSDNGNEFMDIETYLFHNVYNAFKKALKELDFDIHLFAVDIHSCSSCLLQEEKIMMQWRLPIYMPNMH